MKTIVKLALAWTQAFAISAFAADPQPNPEKIVISIGELPVLAVNQNEGLLVQYIQGLQAASKDLKIEYSVVPFDRSVYLAKTGTADFHVPIIHPRKNIAPDLEFTATPIFNVGFVLYTHRDSKFHATQKDLDTKKIEVVAENTQLLDLKNLSTTTCVECSLKKVANRERGIDGLIFAGLETDSLLDKIPEVRAQLRSEMYMKFPVKFLYKKSTISKKKLEALEKLVQDSVKSGLREKTLGGINHYYDTWKPLKPASTR